MEHNILSIAQAESDRIRHEIFTAHGIFSISAGDASEALNQNRARSTAAETDLVLSALKPDQLIEILVFVKSLPRKLFDRDIGTLRVVGLARHFTMRQVVAQSLKFLFGFEHPKPGIKIQATQLNPFARKWKPYENTDDARLLNRPFTEPGWMSPTHMDIILTDEQYIAIAREKARPREGSTYVSWYPTVDIIDV